VAFQKMHLTRPVHNVSRDTIGGSEMGANNEVPVFHVPVQDFGHPRELLMGNRNIRWNSFLFGIQKGVLGDPPQRLLQLGHDAWGRSHKVSTSVHLALCER
jgi:hypothetical protein